MKSFSTSIKTVALFALFLMICGLQTATAQFDYGKIKDNIYTNKFFKVSLKIPETWVVQSREETDMLVEKGKEVVAGDDNNLKASLDASKITTAYMLTVFEYELGTPVDFNSSFMLIAENVKAAPGIKTGKDYLFQARKFMKASQVTYSHIDEEFTTDSIGGKQFYVLNSTIDYLGESIHQRMYSRIIDGFSFNFIISYVEEEQEVALKDVLKTVEFKK